MEHILALFQSFLKIGAFSFGGGYAMIPQMSYEVVYHNSWITNNHFLDIIAISQITPGPISINAATYIGFDSSYAINHSMSYALIAAALTTLSVIIIPMIVMLFLTKSFMKVKDNIYVKKVLKTMRPAIIGLIFAAAFGLINKENFVDAWSLIIFMASLVAFLKFNVNPITITIVFALIGLIIY